MDRLAPAKICMIGCGVVGLATGVAFAQLGHRVRLVESDELRLARLEKGVAPFFEPDLSTLLSKGIRSRRISVGVEIADAMEASDFVFVAVQMPPMKSAMPSLARLKEAAKSIGDNLSKGKVVVLRKAAAPGTTETVLQPILESSSGRKAGKDFGLAVNPEFVRRGMAVQDCLKPSRIVVGSESKKTASMVMRLYEGIDAPKLIMDIKTAEMAKLASNCFLATKISFANEIGNICERIGIDVQEVMEGAGLDPRIGADFLTAGLGFGGTALPRDLSSTISAAESVGFRPELLRAARRINEQQPMVAIEMLEEELGDLRGKRIAILGLAYKSGVDEIRESKAFPIAVEMLARGATVVGYDPLAKASFIQILPEISYASSVQEALNEADACVIQTDDEEFAKLDKSDFDFMKTKVVVDGRRVVSPTKIKKYGVTLRAVGLGKKS